VALPGHDPARPDDPERSVEEIARAVADEAIARDLAPLSIYGHCVGVAVALETARLLEAAGRRVEAVYLSAALPPSRRLRKIEIPFVKLRQRFTGDGALRRQLVRLGGFDGALDDADVAFLMRLFRRDVAAALDYFERAYRRSAAPLRAPVVALLGDRDPFTRGPAARHRAWRFFADSVEVETIAGGGHYFLNHQARDLAALLVRRTRAAVTAKVTPPPSATIVPPVSTATPRAPGVSAALTAPLTPPNVSTASMAPLSPPNVSAAPTPPLSPSSASAAPTAAPPPDSAPSVPLSAA